MNKTLNLIATLSNMSRNELEDEIINLKHKNVAQSEKIDDYEQKIYELKRLLSTSKAMEEHLSSEIESLQRNDKSHNDELYKKVSALEDEILNLKQINSENVQFYELQVQTKDAELKMIIEESKSKPEVTVNNDEINKYTDEICDLKFQIEVLNQQLLDCENKNQEISLKNNSLENHITELTSQLNEIKDCLQVKREELEESKELARNLQDDMIMMQMEIDKFKSLPMETASKGNSLFAEVDDNRVKLQKTVESMKKKYLDMKTQYTSKCQELQKLHMEYAAVMKVIEDNNDSSHEKSELIQTYERHFERLNEHAKFLENELKLQKHACSKLIAKDWKCVQNMISVTREELQTLQRKLNTESLALITSESNHYKTKRDLKRWQAETMQLRAQVVSLNQTIEDLQLQNSPSAETQLNFFKKSCLKNKPLTKIDNWELTEDKIGDFSLFSAKLNDTTQTQETNSPSWTNTRNRDDSLFKLMSATSSETNLMDELSGPKVETYLMEKTEDLKLQNSPSAEEDKIGDFSLFKLNDTTETQESNSASRTNTRNGDNSLFSAPKAEINLRDELSGPKVKTNLMDELSGPKVGINLMDELSSAKVKTNLMDEHSGPKVGTNLMDELNGPKDRTNLMDDLSGPKVGINLRDERTSKVVFKESNKENTLGNITCDTTLNDTVSFLTSKMKKVTFKDSSVEPQKTTKLGGIKMIKAQPVHIPSIRRN